MKQVTFIDEAFIKVQAGTGGDGGMFFHREKFVSHGGPSGGNGGNGGSVFLKASHNENTLQSFRGRTLYKAEEGKNGGNNNMSGANGKDLYIEVPIGTEIIENGKIISDLSFEGQLYLIQAGGKGGRGNASFKSSKNTAPTLYETGEKKK
jgi:GTP-binding protein